MATYREFSQFAFRNRMLIRGTIAALAGVIGYFMIWWTHA
jgi:hypothetical protein